MWGFQETACKSPNGVPLTVGQEKFKHYRDLWRLNLESYAWEQLPGRGGPNARSGHRMAVHKDRLIIFGGFHDNGKQTQCAHHLTYHPLACM